MFTMVYSLFSLGFFAAAAATFLGLFVSCYIPGSLFLHALFKNRKLAARTHILLASVVGMVMLGIQAYLFGSIHLRWLTYGYTFGSLFLFFRSRRIEAAELKRAALSLRQSNKRVLLILLIGTALQCLVMFGSGLRTAQGVEYFQTNAVDGIMHVGYIQAFVRSFPALEPGNLHQPIKNYHYWSDMVMGELSRFWFIPASHLFFQFMPVFVTLMSGIAAYTVAQLWAGPERGRSAGMWSLFLVFGGGDAAYLFMLLFHRVFGFDTPAIDNGVTQFLNPPHAFAKLILLTGLLPLTYWVKKRTDRKWLAVALLLYAPLIGFKIYFGMFVVLGLFFLFASQFLVDLWKSKKLINTIRVHLFEIIAGLLFLFVAAAVYLPPNTSSGGLFFSPLEWPKIFMGPDGINIREWWLRRQTYDAAHNLRNIILLDLFATGVCLISIYGTRLLGYIAIPWTKKTIPWQITAFVVPTTVLFTFLGLYTLQVSGLFNVFNFFVVTIVVLNLYLAVLLSRISASKQVWAKLFLICFVILTVPRAIHDASQFLIRYAQNKYDLRISNEELEGLNFIRQHAPSQAIIISHPDNETDHNTPYVSALTERQSYLSGEGMMRSHNQPYAAEQKNAAELFQASTTGELQNAMAKYGIDYVYLLKHDGKLQQLHLNPNDVRSLTVFQNVSTVILQRK